MFNKFIISILFILVFATNSSLIKQPCNGNGKNCYHVFKLSLSDRPQEEGEKIDATTVKVVKNTEHGDNYYEIIIANGTEITENQYKEILKQLPKNSDDAFVQTVVNNKIYLRPVDSKNQGSHMKSISIPEPQNSKPKPQATASNHFPVILVALLLCIGIVLGILCTGLCLFIAHLRSQPTFDRTNVVTYRKIEISRSSAVGNSRRVNGDQHVGLLMRDGMGSVAQSLRQQHNHTPTTVSQASTSRLAPRAITSINTRQISL